MSLQIIDNIPYIIGIQGKVCESKPTSTKHRKRSSQLPKNNLQQPREPSQSSKLSFLHPTTENSNSMKPGSSSTGMTSACDSQINSVNKKKRKIISSSDSNVKLLQKPYIKSKGSLQRNIQITSPNSTQTNIQSSSDQFVQQSQQNVQPTTINLSQNQVTMNVNTKQSKAKNCRNSKAVKMDVEEQFVYRLQDSDKSNVMAPQQQSVQHHLGNNIHIANSTNKQQQSLTPAQLKTQISTKLNQKNNAKQEQIRSQHLIGGNILITGTNIQQQQQSLFQLRPNISKSSIGNIQQQHQSNIRLTNMNVTKTLGDNVTINNVRKTNMSAQQGLSKASTSVSGPIQIGKKKLSTGKYTLGKVLPENYQKMRKSVMESLLKTNPEMFVGGQTIIGEIIRNPSTTKPS